MDTSKQVGCVYLFERSMALTMEQEHMIRLRLLTHELGIVKLPAPARRRNPDPPPPRAPPLRNHQSDYNQRALCTLSSTALGIRVADMVWWWPAFLGSPHTLPPALGPFVPGYGDVMTGYTLQDGIFVRIYYPTSLDRKMDHSDKWRLWLPHKMYLQGFAYVLGLWNFLMYLLYRFVAGPVKLPAAVQEPIAVEPSRLKTAVFSHGMGGTRFLYSGICCELAAHGYVVAAVEHRDESAAITWFYRDGDRSKQQWLKFRHMDTGTMEHRRMRTQQVQQRAAEVGKTLEFLRSLDQGVISENLLDNDFDISMFKDRLDLSAPVLVGHSFGGATALLTLSQNPEFKTGVILDPWLYPIRHQEHLSEKITQPLLCINMQTFQIAPNLRVLRKFTSGPQPGARRNYSLRCSTHENQSDSVHLIGYWLNFFIRKIDPVVATHLNNALIIRFLREFAGAPGPSLAEASLTTHDTYVVEGLTVNGIKNKSKKIPKKWLSVG